MLKLRGMPYAFAFSQLLLCSVKIKIGVEILKEFSDGVLVGLLLQHPHQIIELVPAPLVGDDCRCKIPQDVRASSLNGIKIPELWGK